MTIWKKICLISSLSNNIPKWIKELKNKGIRQPEEYKYVCVCVYIYLYVYISYKLEKNFTIFGKFYWTITYIWENAQIISVLDNFSLSEHSCLITLNQGEKVTRDMIDKPDNINKLKHLYIKKMSNRITGESYKLGKCFQIYNKDNYLNIYFFKVKKNH